MTEKVTTVELKRDTHKQIYYDKEPFQSFDDYISELLDQQSNSA